MLGEIAAGLSSLKAAADLIKSLNATSTQAVINEVKIGLQERVFEAREALATAQAAQAVALQRIHDLEQEIVQLKDWEREKQRYQLRAVDTGAFAFMPKPGMENSEPPHWLCANCFHRHQKSFLQFKGPDTNPRGGRTGYVIYGCDACKSLMKVAYTVSPSKLRIPPDA